MCFWLINWKWWQWKDRNHLPLFARREAFAVFSSLGFLGVESRGFFNEGRRISVCQFVGIGGTHSWSGISQVLILKIVPCSFGNKSVCFTTVCHSRWLRKMRHFDQGESKDWTWLQEPSHVPPCLWLEEIGPCCLWYSRLSRPGQQGRFPPFWGSSGVCSPVPLCLRNKIVLHLSIAYIVAYIAEYVCFNLWLGAEEWRPLASGTPDPMLPWIQHCPLQCSMLIIRAKTAWPCFFLNRSQAASCGCFRLGIRYKAFSCQGLRYNSLDLFKFDVLLSLLFIQKENRAELVVEGCDSSFPSNLTAGGSRVAQWRGRESGSLDLPAQGH